MGKERVSSSKMTKARCGVATAAERTEHGRTSDSRPGLQHQVGNRALQNLLVGNTADVQRQPGAPVNLLDPALLGSAAQKVIDAGVDPLRAWLKANTNRLRGLNMLELTVMARAEAPQAKRLATVEIESLIREWALVQGINLPPGPVPPADGLSLQAPEAVKKAFSFAVDGVDILPLPGGRLNISVRGATAKLLRSTVQVGWGGNLGIDIPMAPFHLVGSLDKDQWEINLSVPGENSVPDLAGLVRVFSEAETAMRGAAQATAGMGDLTDIPKVSRAVSPRVEPLKKAVQALVDMAKSPRVSAGLSVRGPTGDNAGGEGADSGISVTATVTIQF